MPSRPRLHAVTAMLIAQISDTHILAPDDTHPSAEARARSLHRCVADIDDKQPDAVVFTGDSVQHGTADEYARLHDLLAPLTAPLYLVLGNRDDKTMLRETFAELDYLPHTGGFLHYAIKGADLRLVGLDSTLAGERKGVFCTARRDWLDETLRAAPDRPTVLFMHHPPFDVGDHFVGGYRDLDDRAALAEVVARHPQVVQLMCGHVHCLVERPWAGTRASIMPSLAIDLRRDAEVLGSEPVYMLHRWSAGVFASTVRTLPPAA